MLWGLLLILLVVNRLSPAILGWLRTNPDMLAYLT